MHAYPSANPYHTHTFHYAYAQARGIYIFSYLTSFLSMCYPSGIVVSETNTIPPTLPLYYPVINYLLRAASLQNLSHTRVHAHVSTRA